MFRVTTSVLFASAAANRIHIHEASHFGPTCDDLQANFHDRVGAFQTALDAIADKETTGRVVQGRLMLRLYGIIRTMRRARSCTWVVENDSKDIEQMRGSLQKILAENPCAEAAKAEMEVGHSTTNEQVDLQAIQRALSILVSDTCEVGEKSGEAININDDQALNAHLSLAEDNAQDVIDQMVTEGQESEGAFIQTHISVRKFLKNVGVVFLMLFLALACAGSIALITGFIAFAFNLAMLSVNGVRGPGNGWGAVVALLTWGWVGGAVGLAKCSYEVYNHFISQ